MKRRSILQSGLWAAAAPSVSLAQPVLSGAGYAERDISPNIGMEQPGGYGKSYHRSFHDPCKARAAVFGDGTNRVAVVGVDIGQVPRSTVQHCRQEIARRCGIPSDWILINASHSHSSGPIGGVEPGEYDRAPELVRKLAYETTTLDNPVYVDRVRRGIVDAVVSADASRADLSCGAGAGHEAEVAFNRRFRMKNGQTWTHPGQGNPDILRPAGPIDPVVGVIGSWDHSGRLIGCVVNYCCHATTSPGGISASWIYYLEQAIRGAFGHQAVVVFLQGAAGDITQVDNMSPFRPPSGEAQARTVGGSVGAEAVRVLLSMHRGKLAPVAALNRVVRMKRRAPSAAKVARALETVGKDPKQVGLTDWVFAKEIVLLDAKLKWQPEAEVELQAVQVGPVVILATPAELFVEFGLDMRKRSRFPLTMPTAYSNGQVGYVPTSEALGPRGGGYETRLTSYTNLVPSAGAEMTDICVELAQKLSPGTLPEPARAPKFSKDGSGIGPRPWPYGNVPPELS
ncbi:MAG TPA: hypothetical protein VES20_14680 [Bryobacteraceae bacterium]|nr:hypothetical protein [Bryobacteraceae bacterium]